MNNATQTCRHIISKPHQSLIQYLFSKFAVWKKNYRTRRHLAELPEHLWDDIGMNESSVLKESRKPFWRD
ncbi:DUF1127 domain-containing protein [Vibrio alfacsensis]|uniref:DUF1127 domain-containing protein n=1 Tax=Vibrio alfacsensis TaxID=1074311 RepID=UPI004067C482